MSHMLQKGRYEKETLEYTYTCDINVFTLRSVAKTRGDLHNFNLIMPGSTCQMNIHPCMTLVEIIYKSSELKDLILL